MPYAELIRDSEETQRPLEDSDILSALAVARMLRVTKADAQQINKSMVRDLAGLVVETKPTDQ